MLAGQPVAGLAPEKAKKSRAGPKYHLSRLHCSACSFCMRRRNLSDEQIEYQVPRPAVHAVCRVGFEGYTGRHDVERGETMRWVSHIITNLSMKEKK